MIPLRCDIHKLFDERHFTIVPKSSINRRDKILDISNVEPPHGGNAQEAEDSDPSDPKSQLTIRQPQTSSSSARAEPKPETVRIHTVGHIFNSTPSGDLPSRFHNRALHGLPFTLSVECLFARFAYTIFSPSVFRDFLDSDKGRTIVIWNDKEKRQDIVYASSERCRAIWNASRSRSESPRKRSKSGHDRSEDHGDRLVDKPGCVASDMDSGYGDNSQRAVDDIDKPERGRRRKRPFQDDMFDIFTNGESSGAKRTRLLRSNGT